MASEDTKLGVDGERFVHQAVDGEVLVIDTMAGVYFSLRGAAARLWPLLAAGTTRARLEAAAESAFAAPADEIRAAVAAVIARLTAEGLVRPDIAAASAQMPAALPPGPLEPAEIERYDDMQDLLTLDPVHDVADSGWPNRPPTAPDARKPTS